MSNRRWATACALAFGLVLGACGDDTSTTGGGAHGESCTSASDCGGGLSCVNNVCVDSAELAGSGDAADGSMGDGPVTETRGADGESCTRRGDCQTGLACFDNVCIAQGSEPRAATPGEAGSRGESCTSHSDCISGLGCYSGSCQEPDLGLTVTGKVCERIDCLVTDDCCAAFRPQFSSTQCALFQQSCAADPVINASDCNWYDNYCVCSDTCIDNQCIDACESDDECGTFYCDSGLCVQCASTADCEDGSGFVDGDICRNDNTCGPRCIRDEQCRWDERCRDEECVYAGGCTSDLQCKQAAFGVTAQRAECVERSCIIPCEADGECGKTQKCHQGACTDLGCTDHDECRQILGINQRADVLARCVEP